MGCDSANCLGGNQRRACCRIRVIVELGWHGTSCGRELRPQLRVLGFDLVVKEAAADAGHFGALLWGWAFVGLIDGRRIKEYADDDAEITRIYRHQLAACTYQVLPGPNRILRWSVPAGRGHDDLLISAALTARLDEMDWRDRTARGSSSVGA
jgi:hypothetical protein